MKNKILIIISLTFLFSCINKNKSISNKDLNTLLNKSFSQYSEKRDKKCLLSAYKSLEENQDFKENGLNGANSFNIMRLLFGLTKYDELEKLLLSNHTINKYNRINTLNTVRFLKFKNSDRNKANSYIKESIDMIKDTISKAPKDSLLYADYFSMRMFLVGKDKVFKEIDSMQTVNKKYTDVFYKSILKGNLESYPQE